MGAGVITLLEFGQVKKKKKRKKPVPVLICIQER